MGLSFALRPTKSAWPQTEGFKLIYNNKATKSSAYDGFKYRDVKMCIGLRDVKAAHIRRKGLMPAFSHQNLMEMEPVIRFHLERFLKWLEKFDHTGEYIDCFKWFRYLTFNVDTTHTLGNMQHRIHLGHIFGTYEVVCAPQTTPESMPHGEFFTIRPTARKCDLYFRKRKSRLPEASLTQSYPPNSISVIEQVQENRFKNEG